jgi:cell division protein FtsI/penicillin-binding protein 2
MADPDDLKTAAFRFGYGEKSGLDLPGEASGLLPNDLKTNRTSLYSFAFGQHTLLCTPIQTSVMLSSLANGGKVLKPKIAKMLKGLAPDREMLSVFDVKNGFAKNELQALGIPFSLFTGVQNKEPVVEIGLSSTEVRREISLPLEIRSPLFEGLDRSMWSPYGSARAAAIRSLRTNQELLADYLSLQHQVIGKTSTAEILYQASVNPSSKAHMTKYIWFGALSFSPDSPVKVRYDHPELAVVVFLRFGNVGKDAAPLAAQMVKKWREIKKKHSEVKQGYD